jgi:hypothetical protein
MRTAVIVIPVAIAVPAVLIFVPPLVLGLPAVFSRFLQFVPCVLGLLAVPAVMLHGFVNPMIGPHQAILAFPFVCANRGRTSEYKQSGERCASQDEFPKPVLSRSMFCFHPILLVFRLSVPVLANTIKPSQRQAPYEKVPVPAGETL